MTTSVNQPLSNTQIPQEQPMMQNPVPAQKKTQWILWIMVIAVILAAVSVYYFFAPKNDSTKKVIQTIIPQLKEASVTPTPMPFADMTIPYLREKTYQSKLNELEKAYDGNNYTAYTTSYTSDGLRINGLLTQPEGDAPSGGWPAIVFVHGYIPPASYQTNGQAYSAYVDYLASNGFVVFKIDLRGHGQSEGEPGGAYFSSDYISDVLNAYSSLEKATFVNPKKIGLWGHSMAGNVTMRSWAAKREIPAVVIWAGAVYTYEDMLKYRITDSSYQPLSSNTQRMRRRQQIYEKYGSPSAKVTFWQQVTPVNYLNELKGAIQLHHAVDDEVVNIEYSRGLNELLEQTAIPHEFYEYTSGGHNISGASYNEAMQRTAAFYTTHLK